MKARYRWGLIAAFVLQVGLLGWMIADRALLLTQGKEIRLAVTPVDPRDILRGHYVVLDYDISRVTTEIADASEAAFDRTDTIYVSIEDRGDGWQVAAIAASPPDAPTFLRGTVSSVTRTASGDCPDRGCLAYEVDYNIERFYVPEGAGRELETLRNDQRMSVDVALAGDGRAALKRLLVDGEVRFEEGLY